MVKNLLISLTLIATICSNQARGENKREIFISAATSLKELFSEIGANFEKKNGVKVSFNFAASGQLRSQIENGAPVDVFASAAVLDMNILNQKKLIEESTKIEFAKNRLVLVENTKSNYSLKTVQDLTNSEIKKIAMGNPSNVPAGVYAKEALSFYNLFDQLQERLVFGENVRQLVDYVARNEVEVGIVYFTDTLSNKNIKIILEFSSDSHQPIIYPIAVVKGTKNSKDAKAFIIFLTSNENQKIFKKYGFN